MMGFFPVPGRKVLPKGTGSSVGRLARSSHPTVRLIKCGHRSRFEIRRRCYTNDTVEGTPRNLDLDRIRLNQPDP